MNTNGHSEKHENENAFLYNWTDSHSLTLNLMLFELTPHKPKQGVIDMILLPAHQVGYSPLFPLAALIRSSCITISCRLIKS